MLTYVGDEGWASTSMKAAEAYSRNQGDLEQGILGSGREDRTAPPGVAVVAPSTMAVGAGSARGLNTSSESSHVEGKDMVPGRTGVNHTV